MLSGRPNREKEHCPDHDIKWSTSKLASVSMKTENYTEVAWICELPGSLRYGRFDKGKLLDCNESEPCIWCCLDDEEKEAEKEVSQNKVDSARNEKYEEGAAILESLKVEGLDAHNKSIDLVISTYKMIFDSDPEGLNPVETVHLKDSPFQDHFVIPIKISDASDSIPSYRNHTVEINITLRGKESGLQYWITVQFDAVWARLLSQRMEEIIQAEKAYSSELFSTSPLSEFVEASELIKFNVSMDDHEGGQDHVCIEPGSGALWPGDDLVSLILCLRNDLMTCLDPEMYTIRHQMIRGSSLLSFLRGHSKISVPRLMAYNAAYRRIDELNRHDTAVRIVSNEFKEKFSNTDFPDGVSDIDQSDIFDWAKSQEDTEIDDINEEFDRLFE